jgi:hypothetical protein
MLCPMSSRKGLLARAIAAGVVLWGVVSCNSVTGVDDLTFNGRRVGTAGASGASGSGPGGPCSLKRININTTTCGNCFRASCCPQLQACESSDFCVNCVTNDSGEYTAEVCQGDPLFENVLNCLFPTCDSACNDTTGPAPGGGDSPAPSGPGSGGG